MPSMPKNANAGFSAVEGATVHEGLPQRLLDTAQMRTQYPEWLCRELEAAAEEIMMLRRNLIASTAACNRLASDARGDSSFYKRRCEALQAIQDRMRDPERKAVCDILANGETAALDGDWILTPPANRSGK